MKPYRTQRIALRGLEHQVLAWGDAQAPKRFLIHGWMDVGASYQFLVDAFRDDCCAIAPDLRGFGRTAWQPQGYWFADYLADLEALLNAFAPGETVDLIGHSLGGNIVMQYAGIRPKRVRRVVSLEGFGIPNEGAHRAPRRFAKWLDKLADPPTFAPYANLDAVADRLQKNNARLQREQAQFLARHWAEALPDGSARLLSDPRHKLPFPSVYRMEEVYAIWRQIEAPVLWIAAAQSDVPQWLSEHPEGEAPVDTLAAVRHRVAQVPNGRLVVVDDAAHMVHHDQPAQVAAAIEGFLRAQ